jgi:hypothetical protein
MLPRKTDQGTEGCRTLLDDTKKKSDAKMKEQSKVDLPRIRVARRETPFQVSLPPRTKTKS